MPICLHCLHYILIFGLENLRLRSVLASRLLPAVTLIAFRFRFRWIWLSSIFSPQSASLSHSFDLNTTNFSGSSRINTFRATPTSYEIVIKIILVSKHPK